MSAQPVSHLKFWQIISQYVSTPSSTWLLSVSCRYSSPLIIWYPGWGPAQMRTDPFPCLRVYTCVYYGQVYAFARAQTFQGSHFKQRPAIPTFRSVYCQNAADHLFWTFNRHSVYLPTLWDVRAFVSTCSASENAVQCWANVFDVGPALRQHLTDTRG